MRIVLSGSMGRLALGGYAWMDLQWLAGLHGLGHEVFYVEDCGPESWVYSWDSEELTNDLDYPASFVRNCLDSVGLADRWMYRAGDDSRGIGISDFVDICSETDLFIVHGVPLTTWRPEYDRPRRRIFVDVDPGFIQIDAANGNPRLLETLGHCERLFTIAQRIGADDCRIPTGGFEWLPTPPPLALQHWPVAVADGATHFTCVMQWRGFHEVEFEGIRYGQKDLEFPKFIDLPNRTQQPILIALTGASPEKLSGHGWDVVTGWEVSRTPWSYQEFIHQSRAEFSVAKHGYVTMRGGWFSDRSICYLASGRPVLVEDTGLDWLPVGEGLLTFSTMAEAIAGVEAINDRYEDHCRAARRIAVDVFAADRVLPSVLDRAMA